MGTESDTPQTSGAPLGAEAARRAGLTRRHLARRDPSGLRRRTERLPGRVRWRTPMATQNAARAHKVEVVDEVKTRIGGQRPPSSSDTAASPWPSWPSCGRARRRRRRLQDLQEHAGPAGHRRRRVPAPLGVPERPERTDLRAGRHQRRGQGPAGLLPGQPPAGDQGRAGRRVAALARRPGRAGRPAAPRGAAGPPGGRPRRTDAADGRPPAGPAAQHGLRDSRR